MTFIRYAGHRYPATWLSRMRYTYKKRLLPQPFSYSKSLAFSLDTGFHLAMMPSDDFKPGGKSFRLWATPFHLRRLYILLVSKSRKIGFQTSEHFGKENLRIFTPEVHIMYTLGFFVNMLYSFIFKECMKCPVGLEKKIFGSACHEYSGHLSV